MPHKPRGSNIRKTIIKIPNTSLSIWARLSKVDCSNNPKKCISSWIIDGIKIKKKLPNNGPNTVPAPPIMTIAMNVIEYTKLNWFGSTPPVKVNNNAPHTPA